MNQFQFTDGTWQEYFPTKLSVPEETFKLLWERWTIPLGTVWLVLPWVWTMRIARANDERWRKESVDPLWNERITASTQTVVCRVKYWPYCSTWGCCCGQLWRLALGQAKLATTILSMQTNIKCEVVYLRLRMHGYIYSFNSRSRWWIGNKRHASFYLRSTDLEKTLCKSAISSQRTVTYM